MDEQSLLNVIWRGRYLIFVVTAVTATAAFLLSSRSAKVYEASAILQVHSSTAVEADVADPLRSQQASQGLAKTYATLLDDRSMLQQIAPQVAGGRLSASRLRRKVSARAIEETALIELTVADASPAGARQLAGQIARGFIDEIERSASRRLDEQQRLLEERISAITSEIRTLRERSSDPAGLSVAEQLASLRRARAALTTQLATIIARGIQQGGAVTLVASPTASTTPVSPRPMLTLFASLLLGGVIGVALAAVRTRIDRGLRSAQEAEQILGVPVLASIPLRRRYNAEDRALAEAYDVLYANLAFQSTNGELKIVTVSSYSQGEGKSRTVEGLGLAAVRAGASVLVIDGDLRTGGLSWRLGYGDVEGLANLVLDSASADHVIVGLAPDLSFLPAGNIAANPPSLLSSNRARELIEELREQHGLVIIDAPAVAHLADASILASVSDGIVVVARVGATQRADLRSIAADLRHTSAPIVGLVVLERGVGHPRLLVPERGRKTPVGTSERS